MPQGMTGKESIRRIGLSVTSRSGIGAVLLIIMAAVVFTQSSHLRIGTAAAMGPGYFPLLLGGLFVLLAVLLFVEGWHNPDDRVDIGPLRPIGFVLAAIVCFALLLEVAGGAVAIVALVAVSAMAERKRSVVELVGLAVVVLALVWLIFGFALGLQLHMLPKGLGR